MRHLLLITVIGLSTGVSCSLNSKEIPEQEKPPAEERISMDKSHPVGMKNLQKEKIPTENSTSKTVKGDVGKVSKKQKPFSKSQIKLVKVNGMVCAFCSNSIEKKLKNQETVQSVGVDLKSKIVTIVLTPGGELPDNKIKKLITASGFHVVSIEDKEPDMEQGSKSEK